MTGADEFEAALARFEAAWRAGDRPALAEHLPADADPRLTAELVAIDLEFRWRGELPAAPFPDPSVTRPLLEDYEQLFPRAGSLADRAEDEFRARLRAGDRPAVADYLRRFPAVAGLADRLRAAAADHAAETARLVGGRYRLGDRLGAGGMGEVFRATDTRTGRAVAVKLVRPERLGDPASVRRFVREVRLAGRLVHPNVVRALDAGEENGAPYLAMEYVAGTDLHRRVRDGGPLPAAEACAAVRQAALGLQAAAEAGLVHRDVKPSNLLAAADGRVLLLDFGLAQAGPDAPGAAPLTHSGMVVGTPDFVAPEQVADPRRADTRSDLYSLGCTFYFLLTGRPPFPAGTVVDKLYAHAHLDPEPVEAVRPGVPPAVAGLVRQLMAKSPDQRPQTPAEFVARLDQAVDPDPMAELSSAVAAASEAPAARPRSLGLAVAGLAVGVTAAVAATVWLVLTWPGTPPRTAATAPPDALDQLRREVADSAADKTAVRGRVLSLWQERAAAPGGPTVARLLADLPSPLDRLPAEVTFDRYRQACWGPVRAVAVAPDGRTVAAADDRTVRLLDAATLAERATLPPAAADPTGLVFLPDGRLAVVAADRTVTVWDAAGQKLPGPPAEAGATGGQSCLAVAPGGRLLAGCWNGAVLWDTATWAVVRRFEADCGWATAVAADATRVAVGGADRSVRVWDAATGASLARTTAVPSAAPVAVGFLPGGRLVSAGGWEYRVWEADGRPHRDRSLWPHRVTAAALSPDGRELLLGTDGGDVQGWEPAAGVLRAGPPLHTGEVSGVAWAADGRMAYTAAADGTVRPWNPGGPEKPDERATLAGGTAAVWFAADGETVFALHPARGLVRWTPATDAAEVVLPAEGGPAAVGFVAADGRRAGTLGPAGTADLFELLGGRPAGRVTLPWAAGPAASPDLRLLAAGGNHEQPVVRVWDWPAGRLRHTLAGHTDRPLASAFAPDGRRLATAGADGTLRVWDATTGKPLFTHAGVEAAGGPVAWEPDGTRVLATAVGKLVRFAADRDRREPAGVPVADPLAVAASPDGRLLAVAGQRGEVWVGPPGGVAVGRTWRRPGRVRGMAFAPDGRHLALANGDGTVGLLRVGGRPD